MSPDPDPDPDEFRRFIELLRRDTPDDYTPWLFKCRKNSKAPAAGGSWKNPDNTLTPEKAAEWMERGWNIGIAGCGPCPELADETKEEHQCNYCGGDPDSTADRLINIDIDDEDETSIDDLKPTLIARSRSRTGVHGWYFESETSDIPNITTDAAGEVRTDWQYVVAPGSYVPVEDEAALPAEQQDKAGYYTVERDDPVSTLEYDELPDVFKQHDKDPADVSLGSDAYAGSGQNKLDVVSEDGSNGNGDTDRESDSELFDITAKDVILKENGSTNPSDRWSDLFHGTTTDGNMQFGGDKELIHCYRHNCAHNGLQALATRSEYQGSCEQVGSGHKNADTGPSCLQSEEGAHIWHAWKYAKQNGYIPDGDPVPYVAMKHLCRSRDLCPVTQLPSDGDDTIPSVAWNTAISSIKNHDELNPGRPKQHEFDDSESPPATDGGSSTVSAADTDTATQDPETTAGPSGPNTNDTTALTPTNLRLEAGIGDDESIAELSDREKAAFIWRLIKENETVHIRIVENDDIYAYDETTGTWNADGAGERALKQAARRALPVGCYGSNVFEQLRSQVEADPNRVMTRDEFGLPKGKIAVQNGVVDLEQAYAELTDDTGDSPEALRDLRPTDYAERRLNSRYDPDVDGSEWKSFVGDVVETGMIQTTQEYLGTCLFRGHLAEKALMFVGGGANGKSTFLNIVKDCIGKDNISSIAPGDYRNKNHIAKLESKVANIAAEISGQTLQAEALNKFKNLTGDDDVQAERKYQSPFELNYTGGMMFSTNSVPDTSHVDDDDFAFWRRWLIVQFPNEFPEGSDKRDPNIDDRLQQPSNRSAVLNWMIEGLGQFRENGDTFSNAPSPQSTRNTWINWGDSLEYFLSNVAVRDEDAANISTGEAYEVYKQWCQKTGESTVSQFNFTTEAKTRDLGYGSSSIRTERESTPVRGYTAFGTSEAIPDPVDIVTEGTEDTEDVTASQSIESYSETETDTDDDSAADESTTETETDPDDGEQDQDQDEDDQDNETETDTDDDSAGDDDDDLNRQQYSAGDVNAPESEAKRKGKLKGKLKAVDEFMTTADLIGVFGWDREIMDKTIETLRRDDAIIGTEDTGWTREM